MPAYFKIDKQQKLVMSTVAGVFTMADVLEHQAKLLKDSDFDPSFSHLLDLTHIAKLDIETEEVHTLAQRSIAILANDEKAWAATRASRLDRRSFA